MDDPTKGSQLRLLHYSRFFYFDGYSGAAIANRSLMECMARRGLIAEAIGGAIADAESSIELAGLDPLLATPSLRLKCQGVAVTLLSGKLRSYEEPDETERAQVLRLLDECFVRYRPKVLLTYGGDPLTGEILQRSRSRGIVTVFTLHNFAYCYPSTFANVDIVLVPSSFADRFLPRVAWHRLPDSALLRGSPPSPH